jgi:hypothetical protein
MMVRNLLALVFTCGLAGSAFGFMTVQESNDITPAGKYKLGAEPQFRTSNGTGFNFSGFFDMPLNEESSFRANVGTGETDFLAGASYKLVPIPDYGSQPAIGGKIGAYYWREASENFFTFRFEPMISKKFAAGSGQFNPYAALPVMFNTGKDFNKTTVQAAFGSEYQHPDADNMTFGAEFGLDAKDSFSYISAYVTIYLDDQRSK